LNTAAIIVAAGQASRMQGIDKQFALLGTLPVVLHSAKLFDRMPEFQKIIFVTRPDQHQQLEQEIKRHSFQKEVLITDGGQTRQESVQNGIRLAKDCDYVAIHDGARPLVSEEDVRHVLEDASRFGAATLGVPVKDTIKLANSDRSIASTPPRDALYQIQTPQVFRTALYLQAAEKARLEGKDFTDDCQLMESDGKPVYITVGSYSNLKITTPEDLSLAQTLGGFQKEEPVMRIGHGYDVHRLTEGRKLILGGVDIPHTVGLLGHSDADVLLHAIMDALLGAAALGDIGKHFPDTDPAYKGADSMALLRHVVSLLKEKGYQIGNIDATILAQKPKLAPYIQTMRENIADACGVSVDDINVKATTEEKLGFTGACEGIAAHAVALIGVGIHD
jgi:2-C-methyl-D-erythritol 4-phosphate cytidylyltransferase/2-C-methyl-D-erythritol 2,4-cyclodiphosphate synthase